MIAPIYQMVGGYENSVITLSGYVRSAVEGVGSRNGWRMEFRGAKM